MAVTGFYASLLAVLFIYLSARVITARREARVEIGVGEDAELLRRSRVHANFAEYVPMALVVMALAESVKAPLAAIHVLGLMLLGGRLLHAYALSQTPHILRLRVWGMVLTFATLGIGALLCFLFAGLQILV